MKELIETGFVIERLGVRYIKLITNEAYYKKQSKYSKLLKHLIEKKHIDTSELCNILQIPSNDKNKIKRELRKFWNKIFQILVLISFRKNNQEYIDGRGKLNVKLAAIKNLNAAGGVELGIVQLKNLIKVALRKEYYNIALDGIMSLKNRLAVDPRYYREYTYYRNLYDRIFKIWLYELESNNILEDFLVKANKLRGAQSELLNYLSQSIPKLEIIISQNVNVSKTFRSNYHTLNLYYLNLMGNQVKLINHCELTLLESKKYKFPIRETTFKLTLAIALMSLKQHTRAREIIAETHSIQKNGNANWFKTKEIEVTNELYSGDYLKAWTITKEIIKHFRFNSISQLDQETWKSFHAYLCFLIRAGAFDVSNRERGEANQLKVAVLQQEMPLYNKDKRGANISLLILQILFDLLDKDTELVVNRVEALRKYKQRNLDTKHEHYRTDCFIRMLEMNVKHNFNYKKIVDTSPKWIEKLNEKPRDFSSQQYEVEILPYEVLWDFVLKLTKTVWK